jgi:hypothetical protein
VAVEGVTLAEKVTALPAVEGFRLDVSVTDALAFTTWVSVAELAGASDASPP